MANPVNYGKIMEKTLRRLDEERQLTSGFFCAWEKPKLLLHACCAPCSSAVLEMLTEHFAVTLYFYNPNIAPEEEYAFRCKELTRFLQEAGYRDVPVIEESYDPVPFEHLAEGLEQEPEGGARCYQCYRLRLEKTAEAAKAGGFAYFTTTLSVSPYKRADWLNEIGLALGEKTGVPYLCSDFKKKGGYQRSIALSRTYGLYRQNYCGCRYSLAARQNQVNREPGDSARHD